MRRFTPPKWGCPCCLLRVVLLRFHGSSKSTFRTQAHAHPTVAIARTYRSHLLDSCTKGATWRMPAFGLHLSRRTFSRHGAGKQFIALPEVRRVHTARMVGQLPSGGWPDLRMVIVPCRWRGDTVLPVGHRFHPEACRWHLPLPLRGCMRLLPQAPLDSGPERHRDPSAKRGWMLPYPLHHTQVRADLAMCELPIIPALRGKDRDPVRHDIHGHARQRPRRVRAYLWWRLRHR